MSSVCKRKHCIQRTPFFQILCLQSPPQNDLKRTFMFENNNSGNLMQISKTANTCHNAALIIHNSDLCDCLSCVTVSP